MYLKHPELYAALLTRFGDVKIANEGEDRLSYWEPDPKRQGREKENVIAAGEHYRVPCPACGNDTGHHLYISYMFNTKDEFGRKRWQGLVHCFRRQCERDALKFFDEYILGYYQGEGCKMIPTPDIELARGPLPEAHLPGHCVVLTSLPASHPANVWLEKKREFDPVELSREWDVVYCVKAYGREEDVTGRIVFPVYQQSRLVGWQARHLDDRPTKKYHTMPHFKASRAMFNMDRARYSPIGVVTEGPLDAIRVGPAGVCVFGKSFGGHLQELAAEAWKDGAVALTLDGDAVDDIFRIASGASASLRDKLFPVTLPADKDPADIRREDLRAIVNAAAARAGIRHRLS